MTETTEANPRKSGVRKKRAVPKNPKNKNDLKKEAKLALMQVCIIYGKSYAASAAFFQSRGFELGETKYTELRNELLNRNNAKDWFSKEALFVIEQDHMLSVQRIKILEDRLMQEFEHVASTNFYKYLNAGTDEQELVRNKAHDANVLMRIIAQYQSLQETKTKMMSATPLVQEMMEVHAMRENEENIVTPLTKHGEEKVIPNVTPKQNVGEK